MGLLQTYPHGNSVVDYFILSESIINSVNSSVENEIFSWHMSLIMSLNVTNLPEKGNTPIVCKTSKIIWNDDKVNEFTNIFNHFKN